MNTEVQSISRLPIEHWKTEHLRLTLFPDEDIEDLEQNWWYDLVGELPEAGSLRPKMRGRQEQGAFEKGKLVLTLRPRRIDWMYSIDLQREPDVEGIFTIGHFHESLDQFSTLMSKWFGVDTCPSAKRLAFGAILLYIVKDRQAGHRQLSAYLHDVKVDAENSTDLSYRINRPRPTTTEIAGLKINRLSAWSVAGMTIMQGEFEAAPPSAEVFQEPERFACRLALDINTDREFEEHFVRTQLPTVFRELTDLGQEIVREGDIP
jgi:hypothetical protein